MNGHAHANLELQSRTAVHCEYFCVLFFCLIVLSFPVLCLFLCLIYFSYSPFPGMQRFGSAVSVTYLSRRNPFRPMTVGASLLQVSRALSTQLHRVPIVDESGKCIGIVSQSVLIQFLAAHRDELKDELRQTVGGLQLGMCKVISVTSDASAWQAFKVSSIQKGKEVGKKQKRCRSNVNGSSVLSLAPCFCFYAFCSGARAQLRVGYCHRRSRREARRKHQRKGS